MHPDAHNPIQALLRILGVAAVAGMAYLTWQAGLLVWSSRSEFDQYTNRWDWALAVGNILLLLGLIAVGYLVAISAIRAPSRSHLALALAIPGLLFSAFLSSQANRFLQTLLTPSAYDAIGHTTTAIVFLVALVPLILIEWRLGKSAGFIPADTRYWSERNIRGTCALLAWIAFFTLMPWVGGPDALRGTVREEYMRTAEMLSFFSLIAGCILFAKAVPSLLIHLTDAPRDDPTHHAKKRRFRLY